jgi:hypothetical protein
MGNYERGNAMTKREARKIIKTHADSGGYRYRITKSDAVHYFQTMTNGRFAGHGWIFMCWDYREFANEISEGRA